MIKNEPYDNIPLLNGQFTKGQYTLKKYFLASKVPKLISALAPSGSLELQEEAWNAYPYCKTVLSNPNYMKENFFIKIETFHYADRGTSENIHELDKDQLKKREVVVIDISDPVSRNDYKPDEDPTTYTSTKTGRGPLRNEAGNKWKDSANPVMTCYKVYYIFIRVAQLLIGVGLSLSIILRCLHLPF